MDKFDELKDLIKSSLDSNGKLAQVKAQIKASVYNTIDNVDTKHNESQFYWENKKIQKLSSQKEGQIALEIVKDFLEFYSLDYSNNVYTSEANVPQNIERPDLSEKCNILYSSTKPVLMQMVEAFVKQDFSGGIGGTNSSRDYGDKPSYAKKQTEDKKFVSKYGNNKMDSTHSSSFNKQAASTAATSFNKYSSSYNKKQNDVSDSGNYEEDNFEQIQEDVGFDEIELDDEDDYDTNKKTNKNNNNKQKNGKLTTNVSDSYGRSYGGLQTSQEDVGLQSQGFDKSVDSLELEDYDYYEEAVKKKKR